MTAVVDRELSLWQDEVVTSVKVAGAGPPLVYFHGPYGLHWDPFLDSLTQHHQVFAPMHPGTDGKHHDAVRSLTTLSDLVVCYAELFDALGLEHAVVVGHSFGGMIAAEVAAVYPRFVDRLVLLSPIGLWRDDAPVTNWMMLDAPSLPGAMFADPDGPAAREAGAAFAKLLQEPEAVAAHLWATACTGEFVWPIPDRGLKRRIHRISAPALVVWGREDAIVSRVYAEEFGRRLRDARVEIVDGAGHLLHVEQPETVQGLVREFLAQ